MQFLQSLPVSAQTIDLLLSNVFMTFAWYGHLKNLATSPWYIAALDYLWAALCMVGAVYFIFRSA